MAALDYGSVVKRNGKIIQKDFYMDMKEAVGFTIDKLPYSYEYRDHIYDEDYNRIGFKDRICYTEYSINDSFFSYIGDKDLLVCIYKSRLMVISKGVIKKDLYGIDDSSVGYSKQRLNFTVDGVNFSIKKIRRELNRFQLRFWYKGDLYEVMYGYGVDVNKKVWYYLDDKEKKKIYKWFES